MLLWLLAFDSLLTALLNFVIIEEPPSDGGGLTLDRIVEVLDSYLDPRTPHLTLVCVAKNKFHFNHCYPQSLIWAFWIKIGFYAWGCNTLRAAEWDCTWPLPFIIFLIILSKKQNCDSFWQPVFLMEMSLFISYWLIPCDSKLGSLMWLYSSQTLLRTRFTMERLVIQAVG